MKKNLTILIIGLFIVLTIFITVIITIALIKTKKENERIDAEAVTLKENLTIGFGEKVKVSDFLQNLNGTILNDYIIDTERIGTCEVSFEFLNIKNKKKVATFYIEIIDKIEPQILSGGSFTVQVGYKKNLTEVLLSGDDIDDEPQRKIEGYYDLNTIGDYPLEYVVTDASGNESKKEFILHVVEKTSTNVIARDIVYLENVLNNYKNEKTKIGIDVSKWQGEINWEDVKNSGIEFAILRVGYQKDYDNREYEIDPYFYANIEGAKNAGIPVGLYFYSYAKTIDEAIEQAQWVKDKIKDYDIELPIAFDWESWTSFNKTKMSFYKINKIANTFLDTLTNYGYKGMLYSSKNYLETIWYPTKHYTWLANYTNKTLYEGEYFIWQMCDTGRVNGINGAVDIDIMYIK